MARSGFERGVRDWYVAAFPTDDLGFEIPTGLTFKDVDMALDAGWDVYALLGGAADSVIRERVFGEIDVMFGGMKESCYDRWMACAA